ncbi:MAG: hypothetical protein CMC14_03355 [Flavobacteriaceae bacterium]|nr:hypothetical protein [Flavobacteriaceae bacterium]|tara:strand:- start:64085 stop:64738 length:654 start_codon:yes stop_codon:yes gene_type:complete
MKRSLILCTCIFAIQLAYSQIESNTNSIQFEINETNTPESTGLELPARKKPTLTIPLEERDPNTTMSIGEEENEKLDMTKTDGLLDNKTDMAPKAFSKDKEPSLEFDRDMNLGDIKTEARFVSVQYRDHEYVDGDLIRVYVNDDIVQSSVFLNSSFSGFTLTLEEGINKIEFEALNQGSSGPNTAELHVYDDNGLIVSAKEWNLLTGRRAIITVIKE